MCSYDNIRKPFDGFLVTLWFGSQILQRDNIIKSVLSQYCNQSIITKHVVYLVQ